MNPIEHYGTGGKTTFKSVIRTVVHDFFDEELLQEFLYSMWDRCAAVIQSR